MYRRIAAITIAQLVQYSIKTMRERRAFDLQYRDFGPFRWDSLVARSSEGVKVDKTTLDSTRRRCE